MKKIKLLILLGNILYSSLSGQFVPFVYKSIDSVDLSLNVYYPEGEIPDEALPAIVFYFGGGWVNGTPDHFSDQCEYLASRGIIAIAADYRTQSRHGTTPLECIADAKSVLRWIRANNEMLMIVPDKIVAAGGSAGGHLAACCALVDEFNDPIDDIAISAIPNALVLFNPVISTMKDGYGNEKLGSNALAASPLHQLKPGLPPTLIFHGSDDKLVKLKDIEEFATKAVQNGDECELMIFDGRGHGFFNKRGDDEKDYWKTLLKTEKFLINKEFLPSSIPELDIE